MNSKLKIQLDKITSDLAKTDGVDGSLIVDSNGEVLSHHLLHDVDIELFGPMANVITGSSKRLIDSSNHGEIERVLVESKNGKALFLHLGNVHFIVLMKNNSNVGMIMISSKRASQEIMDLTKDLKTVELGEQVAEEEVIESEPETVEEEEPVEVTPEEIVEPVTETIPAEEITTEPVAEALESTAEETTITTEGIIETVAETAIEPAEEETIKTVEDTTETVQEETVTATVAKEVTTEETTTEPITEESEIISEESEVPAEEKTPDISIPVIRPPIAFPKLEKVAEIPEDESERIHLLLKIYESIFLAMSIGASKIMGVAPARGLTRKFLPVEDCKILLDGVDVKNNSAIDFVKIQENAEKIPLSEREQIFKESFGKIIAVITENYGKVMGYSAFRAMIRPEFKIINESYGSLLDELGVKDQLHPELLDFFN